MFQNLGNTLALIRNLRRKSQAQIARDAGIGRSQLSRYENGTELPGLDPLSSILGALDISIHEFLFTLALVDERASLLSSCDASTQRSLLVIPRQGGSLELPKMESVFDQLQTFILNLHRLVYAELVFRQVPEPESGKLPADEGTAG